MRTLLPQERRSVRPSMRSLLSFAFSAAARSEATYFLSQLLTLHSFRRDAISSVPVHLGFIPRCITGSFGKSRNELRETRRSSVARTSSRKCTFPYDCRVFGFQINL